VQAIQFLLTVEISVAVSLTDECLNPLLAIGYQFITVAVHQGISGTGLDASRFPTFGNAVQARSGAEGALVCLGDAGEQVTCASGHIKGTSLYTIATTAANILIIGDETKFMVIQGMGGTDLDTTGISTVHFPSRSTSRNSILSQV